MDSSQSPSGSDSHRKSHPQSATGSQSEYDSVSDSQSPDELQMPRGMQLPPELVGPPPRELPESFHQGRVAVTRQKSFWVAMLAGGACAALALLPFVKTLGLYILPLGYLAWIGVGICAIGVWAYVRASAYRKARKYVEAGDATFARVSALAKAPGAVVNGQTTTQKFLAQLELKRPLTGELTQATATSPDFPAQGSENISTRFRVGDWVPVVWMPGEFDATLQVYDFVEAMPDSGLVREKKQQSLWMTLLQVAVAVMFFFLLFWNIYAFGKYQPIEFGFRDAIGPIIVGGLLGLAIELAIYLRITRDAKRVEKRNAEAAAIGEAIELPREKGSLLGRIAWGMLLTFGAILLGAMTVICLAYSANAIFDTSESKPAPVQITQMTETTHSFIFREYTIEYQLQGKDKEHKLLTTPHHMDQFMVAAGTAQVREGRFGWPWVETIDPIVPNPPLEK